MNIYNATVPDRMHHLDLGLFRYQVTYTRDMLKSICGQIAIDDFDQCLAEIPRYPGLKVFKKGLGNIKQFTADEFRNMMKVLVFVVDGLIVKHRKSSMSFNTAKHLDNALVELYVSWNKMYLFSQRDSFSDTGLVEFKECLFIVSVNCQLTKT